ncbi:MAG: hypothetical protein ACTSRS_06295 [Candidatus Helarchaeota archaeon]
MEANSFKIELKKHLNNIVEALIALCPTRNYISQFISFLPEEYSIMYDSFGIFLADKEIREPLSTLLGLSLGPQIKTREASFGEHLMQIINFVFTFFQDPDQLKAWNSFLQEVRENPIPNVYGEWIEAKIKLAINDPTYGDEMKTLLRYILVRQNPTGEFTELSPRGTDNPSEKPQVSIPFPELELSTKIPKDRLEKILNLLKDQLSLLHEEQVIDQNGIPQAIWYFNKTIDIQAVSRLLLDDQKSE